MLNTSYYMGDINSTFQFPGKFYPGAGLIYRYNFNDRVAFKANVLYGRIYAHDRDSDSDWQQNRNLSFRSDVFEISAQVEVNFLTYEIGDSRRPSSPYLFAGIGVFRFNPQAELNDKWVDLQPLGTEGQGIEGYEDRYVLTQFCIPFGVGYKFNIYKGLAGAIEWGIRKTFTDYLDDVSTAYVESDLLEFENGPLAQVMADRSLEPLAPDGTNTGYQRGYADNNDWYIFTGIMLTYKIGKPQVKCPTTYN